MVTLTPSAKSSPALRISSRPEAVRCRAVELISAEIAFIPHPDFATQRGRDADLVDSTLRNLRESAHAPADLPAYIRRLCESELLTRDQEAALFREMNRLKYQASVLRERLDADHIDRELVTELERLLSQARTIRDHIIQANLRLVISIVKKFVTPQCLFDELLSNGVHTLMNAVEKFDFDRGFRFSTYAYRSISRDAYRYVTASQKEATRFVGSGQEWSFEPEADPSSTTMSDHVWSNLRGLTTAMLGRLDRRERFIIRCRYALGSHRKARTFQDMANRLGVSKERVRQLERRAVAKLRDMATDFETDQLFTAAML